MSGEEAMNIYKMSVISEITGIPYMKIRNNSKKLYNSLTKEEKEKIKKCITEHSEHVFAFLDI